MTAAQMTHRHAAGLHNGQPRIALIGPKGAGKTTFAQGMARAGFRRYAFANPLKAGLHNAIKAFCETVGLLPPTWQDFTAEKEFYRPLLQWFGYDYVRIYHNRPTHWIDLLTDKVLDAHLADGIVVDDCRYPNELEALNALGFTVIRIMRPGLVRTDEHSSESLAWDITEDAYDELRINDAASIEDWERQGYEFAGELLPMELPF